jgi:HK97 family phage prohead protease
MSKIHKAFSLVNVKTIEQEGDFYVIRGTATTPEADRQQDIVEPLGARYAETIPLLWMHDSQKPVGLASFGTPTQKGIPFTARLPKVKEAGALRDRIEEAVQSIKYRLVAAVSIGFRVLNNAIEHIANGGVRFLQTEIIELSLVVLPANASATIASIKSLDSRTRRAVSGQVRAGVPLLDGKKRPSAKLGRKGTVPLVRGKSAARRGVKLIRPGVKLIPSR